MTIDERFKIITDYLHWHSKYHWCTTTANIIAEHLDGITAVYLNSLLKPKSKWHKISDEVPEHSDPVLLKGDKRFNRDGDGYCVGYFDGGGWWYDNHRLGKDEFEYWANIEHPETT